MGWKDTITPIEKDNEVSGGQPTLAAPTPFTQQDTGPSNIQEGGLPSAWKKTITPIDDNSDDNALEKVGKKALDYIDTSKKTVQAAGLKALQGIDPFHFVQNTAGQIKSLGNDRSVEENQKDIQDWIKSKTDPYVGELGGGLIELGTGLAAGPTEINMIKNALKMKQPLEKGNYLLNLIKSAEGPVTNRIKDAAVAIGKGGAEGAAIGGAAGLGSGDNSIYNHPEQSVENTLSGIYGGAKLGATLSSVGQAFANKKTAEKLGQAFQEGVEKRPIFGELPATKAKNLGTQVSDEMTQRVTNPLTIGKNIYSAEMENAGKSGQTFNPLDIATDPNALPEHSKNAKNFLENSENVAKITGSDVIKEYNKKLLNGTLNPQEAKNYSTYLQEIVSGEQGAGANYGLRDAALNTKKAIESELPNKFAPGRYEFMQNLHSGVREPIEALMTKGQLNPNYQNFSVKDKSMEDLLPILNDKFRGQILPDVMRQNLSSSVPQIEALQGYSKVAQENQASLNNKIQQIHAEEMAKNPEGILAKTYGNPENKIDYQVPDSIKKIQDAATKQTLTGTTASTYGGEAGNKAIGAFKNILGGDILSLAGKLPYKLANVGGLMSSPIKTSANFLEGKLPLQGALGAGVEGPIQKQEALKRASDVLQQSPVFAKLGQQLGKGLNQSITNPGNSMKNATLMKLMQNPWARQLIGIDFDSKNSPTSIPGVVPEEDKK